MGHLEFDLELDLESEFPEDPGSGMQFAFCADEVYKEIQGAMSTVMGTLTESDTACEDRPGEVSRGDGVFGRRGVSAKSARGLFLRQPPS